MKDTILSYIVVALGCVCIALALVTWRIKRTARNDALEAFEKQYKALLEENKRLDIHDTLTLCYADGLEQELERMTNTCDMLKKELHTLDHDIEVLVDENASLKAQVEVLTKTVNDLGNENEEMQKAAPIAVKRVRKKAGSE